MEYGESVALKPGDTIEHFVVVSLLGQGGMGQVYLARDASLQRHIALKIVRPEASGGAPDTATQAPRGCSAKHAQPQRSTTRT